MVQMVCSMVGCCSDWSPCSSRLLLPAQAWCSARAVSVSMVLICSAWPHPGEFPKVLKVTSLSTLFITGRSTYLATALCIVRGCLAERLSLWLELELLLPLELELLLRCSAWPFSPSDPALPWGSALTGTCSYVAALGWCSALSDLSFSAWSISLW